jgi:hypothetical protein
MYHPFWESVKRLERCGFKVMALTCDGLAANRLLYKLHSPRKKELTYSVLNPYASPSRQLYFFSDPPHLMKTVRNAWANSKRKLEVSYCVMKAVLTGFNLRSMIRRFPGINW